MTHRAARDAIEQHHLSILVQGTSRILEREEAITGDNTSLRCITEGRGETPPPIKLGEFRTTNDDPHQAGHSKKEEQSGDNPPFITDPQGR